MDESLISSASEDENEFDLGGANDRDGDEAEAPWDDGDEVKMHSGLSIRRLPRLHTPPPPRAV